MRFNESIYKKVELKDFIELIKKYEWEYDLSGVAEFIGDNWECVDLSLGYRDDGVFWIIDDYYKMSPWGTGVRELIGQRFYYYTITDADLKETLRSVKKAIKEQKCQIKTGAGADPARGVNHLD